MKNELNLGKIALFGSGETSPSARPIYERLLADIPPPITISILETPAGFQPNSEHVAGQVGRFFSQHLRNLDLEIRVIPARKRESPFSPDDPGILDPILDSSFIFLGPGSPTYTVRNLQDTLALRYLLGRHQAGAVLCLASAATLAAGDKVIPVYEIFKAGDELHWADGLGLLGRFGLDLAIVPHWNNREGGEHLDTSRCFMGRQRFEEMLKLLPAWTTVLGIDEHTAIVFDLQKSAGHVLGKGGITIMRHGGVKTYHAGSVLPLEEIGPFHIPDSLPEFELPRPMRTPEREPEEPSPDIVRLVDSREEARRAKDWARADALREQLASLGFEVQDTPEGPRLRRKVRTA